MIQVQKCRLLLTLMACVATTLAYPAEDSLLARESQDALSLEGFGRVYKFLDSCGEKDVSLCLKMRALTFVDRALRRSDALEILDGVSLVQAPGKGEDVSREVNGRALSEAELDASLPKDAEERDAQVETLLVDRVARFLQSHTLQLKVPDSAITEVRKSLDEARGKKKKLKMLLPLLLLLKLKAAALIPLALGGLALLALKALVVGKLALVLAAIIGLQKLLGNRQSSQTYEVVAHPTYSQSHVSSFDEHGGGHGHYGRSMPDPQELAYNAYVDNKQE
uniref:Osiris 9 n=2 Tax=Timema TaxID=61471 RepID=A0A7R9G2C2_TIMSH|nr:unnamed protein product [Timema shepardi]CAD7576907.1 unnamed protein product [Timema californicum]